MARRKTHTETWWANAPAHILRCNGHNKTDGARCRAEAAPGTTVCDRHGALAPAVAAAAANRIQMSVDEAAQQLVSWMNDPAVDMRERVKIAHDLLDRGGLGATQKHLVGIGQMDPVEQLFQDILASPNGLVDPTALPPPPESIDYVTGELAAAEDSDVVDAEAVEDRPAPDKPPRAQTVHQEPYKTPKHIREALERLL